MLLVQPVFEVRMKVNFKFQAGPIEYGLFENNLASVLLYVRVATSFFLLLAADSLLIEPASPILAKVLK